jgi:competence protein ComEA
MQDARVRWVMAAIAVVVGVISGVSVYNARRASSPPVLITGAIPGPPPDTSGGQTPPAINPQPPPAMDPAASGTPTPQAPQVLLVHVAGAVKHPDLYSLPPDSRVANAIKAAGGATAQADVDAVNLAEKVTDGEKVYVPHKGEVSAPAPAGNTIGYGAPTPAQDSGGSRSVSDKLTDPSQGQINLNTASATDLERLPGVGPATAARIIAYRQQNGGFKSPQGLMDVGGIGEKRMARIAPFVVAR